MTEYRVYDVFTDTTFGGNPLAVIPQAQDLPEEQLQRIAREFNFSETVFIFPPQDPAHTARVRIFTPVQEIPFAGHPTIGAAIALRDLGAEGPLMLELGVGPLPCEIDDANGASFATTAPLRTLARPDLTLVARAIGLSEDDIDTSAHPPVQATLGLPFTIVALSSRDALARCKPATDAYLEGMQRYPTDGLNFAVFAYVRDGNHVDARMFSPLDNMPEDPATGSASATLAALLCDLDAGPVSLDIHQGYDMGRPSQIKATADGAGTVTIAGNAVMTMEGRLVL